MTAIRVDPEFESQLSEAIKLHNRAVAGHAESVRVAKKAFENLHQLNPTSAVTRAYLGSSLILMARDEVRTYTRMQLAKQGLKHLDEAILAEPWNRTIRLLRGLVTSKLPEQYFHRSESVIEDFIVLLDGEIRHPGSLDERTYKSLIEELGQVYRRTHRLHEADLCEKQVQILNGVPVASNNDGLTVTKSSVTPVSVTAHEERKPASTLDLVGALLSLAGISLFQWTQNHS
ncbi:MAG: hypothetical protein P0Y55_01960 [Candidatus Cohnella colombiensis]|uniref:Uncharacterized protein n=1 Tax=Candidatus Cohnella colombiensis TaxID=3121368 RepID=A0AA95EWS5_9BACL|nr:MAG: hypothetical protein P0Y55_01960 [Cohnella sp.]